MQSLPEGHISISVEGWFVFVRSRGRFSGAIECNEVYAAFLRPANE